MIFIDHRHSHDDETSRNGLLLQIAVDIRRLDDVTLQLPYHE
jgi:hypothetical protein